MAEPVAGDVGQGRAGILHHNGRDALACLLAHDGGCALLERHADILVAIGGKSAHCDEQVAGFYRARIIAHLLDLGIQIDRSGQNRDIFQQIS